MSTAPDKDNKAPDPKEVQAPKAGDSQVAKVEDKAHQAGLQESQGPDALKIIQKQAENTATAHVPGLTIVDNGKAVKPGEKSEGVMSYVNAAVAKGTEAVSVFINEAEKGIKAVGKVVGIGGDAEGEGKKTEVAAAKSGDKSQAADKDPAANASDKAQTAGTHKVITDGGSVAIGGPITGDGRVNRDSVIFRGPSTSLTGSDAGHQLASSGDVTSSRTVTPEPGFIKASLVTQSENAPDAKATEVATPRPKLESSLAPFSPASDAVNGVTRVTNNEAVRPEDGKGTSIKQPDGTETAYTYEGNLVKSSLTRYPGDGGTKEQLFTPSGTVTITRDASGAATVKAEVPGANAIEVKPGDAIRTNASGQAVITSANGNERVVFGNGTSQLTDKATGEVTLYNLRGDSVVVPKSAQSNATTDGEAPKAKAADAPSPVVPNLEVTTNPKANSTDAPSVVSSGKTVETAKEAPAVAKEAPAVAKEAPAVAKEAPAVAKEAPAVAKEAPAVAKEAPAVAKDAPPAKPAEPEKEKSVFEQGKELAGKAVDGAIAVASVAADAAVSLAKTVKEYVVGPDDIKFGDEKYSKSGDKWKGADGKLYNDVTFDKDAKKLVLKGVDGSVEEHLESGEKVITSKDANDRTNVVKLDASGKPTEVSTDGQKLQLDPTTKKWTDDTGRAVNDVAYNASNGDVSINWNGTTVQTVSRSGESNVTDAQRGFSAKYDAKGNLTEVQDKSGLYKSTEDPAKPGQPVWKDGEGNALTQVSIYAKTGEMSIVKNDKESIKVTADGVREQVSPAGTLITSRDGSNNEISVKLGVDGKPTEMVTPSGTYSYDASKNQWSRYSIPIAGADFNRATGEIIIRKDADNTITTKLNGEVTTVNKAAGNLKTEFDAKGEVKAISSDYIGSLTRQQDPLDSTKSTFVDDKGISGYKVQKGLLDSVDITKPNGDKAFVMPNGLRGEMTADATQSRWFDKDNQLTQVRDGIDSYLIDRTDPAKPQILHQSDGAAVNKIPILDANASAADKANYPYATLDKATGALTVHDSANTSYTKNPDFSTTNRISDGNASTTILSDKTGNLVSIETSKTVDGRTLSVTTDASGRVQSATLPDGSKVEYVPGDSAHNYSYLKTSLDGKTETIGGVTNDFAAGLKYSDSKGNLQTINADGTRVEIDVTQGRIKNFSASGDMTSMVDTKDGFTYTFKYDANHNLTEVTNRAGVWQIMPGTTDPVTGEAKWLRTATVAQKASDDGTFAVTAIKNPTFVWEGKNSTAEGEYNFVKKSSDAARPIMDGQNNQIGTLYVGQNGTQYRIMGTGDNIKSMEISKDNGKTFVAVDLTNKSVNLDSATKLPVITEKTADGKLVGTQAYDAKGGIISRDENNNIVRTVDAKGNGYEYFRDDKTGEIMGVNSLKNGVTNIAVGGIGDKYGIDATTKMPVVIHPDKSTTSFDGKGGEVVRNADGLTTSVKQADGTLTTYALEGSTVKSSLTKYPDSDVTKEQFFTPSGTVTVVRDSTGVASVKSDVPGAVAFDVQPGQTVKTNALGQVVIESANGNQRTVFGTGTSQYLDKATGAVSLYNIKGELISATVPPVPGAPGTKPGAAPSQGTAGDGSAAPVVPPRGQPLEGPKQPNEAPKPIEPGKAPVEPGKAPVDAGKLPPEPAKPLPPVNDPSQGALDKGKVVQVNPNDVAALDQLLSGVVKQQAAANAAAAAAAAAKAESAPKAPEPAPAPKAAEAPTPPRAVEPAPAPKSETSQPASPSPAQPAQNLPKPAESPPATKESVVLPKLDPVSAPKTETVSAPKTETVSAPKTETVNTPKLETVNTPKLEPVNTPKLEPVNVPKQAEAAPAQPAPRVETAPAKSDVSAANNQTNAPRPADSAAAPQPGTPAKAPETTPVKSDTSAAPQSVKTAEQAAAQPAKSVEQAATQPGQAAPVLQKSADAAASPAKSVEGAPANNASAAPIAGKDAAAPAANAAPKGDAASTAAAAAVIIAAGKIMESASAAPKPNAPSPSETQARDTSKANQEAAAAQASKAGEASALPNANQSNVNQNANPANTAVPKGTEAAPASAVKTAEVVPAAPVSKPDAGTTTQARDTVTTTAPATGLPASGTSSGQNTGTTGGTGPANQSASASGANAAGSQTGAQTSSQNANLPGGNTQGNQTANQANSGNPAPQPNTQTGTTATTANTTTTGQPNAANNSSGSLNQQGSGGAVATPVQAGHTATGTQTGTQNAAQQGTGNQTGNVTGAQTGANASQTGSAASQTTTANPAGHTPAQNAQGSQSSVVTGQPAGAQTGNANTGTQNAGTQNQQGAGSATASPVLPGGHSTTNTTTGQTTNVGTANPAGSNNNTPGQSNIPVAGHQSTQTGNSTITPNAPQSTTGTTSTGNQNQQGAGSATVTPVVPGGQTTGNTTAQTGVSAGATHTGVNTPDPTGHAGTVSGTTSTSSSNNASSSNISTGANQTGQNQQGSAGSVASPILPGGHINTGTTTGQTTGTTAGQATGTNPGQVANNAGTAATPTGATGNTTGAANTAAGTGHTTTTSTTAQNGIDPSGHATNSAGTTTTGSGTVAHQQANNSTGATTTTAGQTGQSQQGSVGTVASSVVSGTQSGTGANAAQGTGANTTQGTGANTTQGAGVNTTQGTVANTTQGAGVNTTQGTVANTTQGTGANTTQGTGAVTQTGTSQSGNDPAGHTGTTTGTSAGTTSGAIGNQTSNNTAGSNTTAGTTPTGQNQQGSAGSAASPVLPGGHTGNATGTVQSTGTNTTQSTGAAPAQGTGANTTQGTGATPAQGTGANTTQGTGATPAQGTGANTTQGTGATPAQGTGAATQTGTTQSSNDPAGHTGTTAGTSTGTTSGAIGNQTSNNTTGSNTTAGTIQTGQNQQGSAGSAASPVLPGGQTGNAAGTGQSTGTNTTQGTGANPAQGTGTNTTQGTGATPAQGTGAATQTGTTQSGNEPAGHTGTTTGTSAGTTSGAIGNQTSNNTTGSNTTAGTIQTGQNQQGSAGSAASPVLPGGQTGNATGTGQGNGTNATQGTGASATQGTGASATQGSGTNTTQGSGANAGQAAGTNAGQGNATGSVNSPVGAGTASSPAGTAQSGNDPAGRTGTATGATSGNSPGSTSGAIGNQPTNSTAGSNTTSGNTQTGQNQQGSAGNAAAPVSSGGQTQSGTATGAGASATAGTNAGQASGVNAGQGANATAGQAAGTNNSQGTVTNSGQGAGNAASNGGVVGQSGTSSVQQSQAVGQQSNAVGQQAGNVSQTSNSAGTGQVLNTPANNPAAQPGAASQAGGQAAGSNGAAHSPVGATGTPGAANATSGNTAGTQAGAIAGAVSDPSGASTVQQHAPQSSSTSSISNTTNAPAGSTTPATSTSNSSAPAASSSVVNAPVNQSTNQSSNIPSSGHSSTTSAATTPSGAIGSSQSGAMGGGGAGGSATSNTSVPSGNSAGAAQGQVPASSATNSTASNAPVNNSGAQTTSNSSGEPGTVQDPSMSNNANATVDPGAINSSVLQDPTATTGSAPTLPDPSQTVSAPDPDQSADPSNSATTNTASTPAQPAAPDTNTVPVGDNSTTVPDATTVPVVDYTTSVDPQFIVNVGPGIDEVIKVNSGVVADNIPINIDMTAPTSASSIDSLIPPSIEQLTDGILNVILNEATAPVVAPVVDVAPSVGYSEPILQSFDPVILDQIITSSTSTPSKSESPEAVDSVVIDTGTVALGPNTGYDASQDAMDALLLEQRQMAERQRALDELAALQQQMGYGQSPQVEASTNPDGWGTSSVDSATYFGPLDDYIAASYSDWMDQGTSSYDGVSSFGTPYQDVISNWSTNSSFGQPVNDSGLPAPDAMSAIYDDLNNPDSYSVLPPNSNTVGGAPGDNLITRYADQSNGVSDSGSTKTEPAETNIISDKTNGATVASNEGLPVETNELPNWLDQSMANLGASGLIVEPPRAPKQEETIDMAPPANVIPDSERLDIEAVTGLKSDLQSYDEKEARWQEVQELQQRLADAINSFAEATRNQVNDVTAQGIEFGADVRQNTEQVLQDLNQIAEEEARLIRENERERLEEEKARRSDDAKEQADRLTAQQAEHKKHQQERELHLKEEKERKLAQEMATILAVRQQSEAEARARELRLRQEREVLQEMIRKDNLQEKYVVRPNEDLYMIAVRKFKDPRVADLIYELNKTKVEVRWTSGKRSYYVQPGAVLLLPSPRQSREWLARQMTIVGKVPPRLGMSGTTSVGADERRSNIERVLGKIKEASNQNERTYSVRLGDTLRSVAMKHPDLRDVTLWKLLATKNGLTSEMDSKGSPLAILIRGSILNIPTAEEISAYRAEHSPTKSATKEPYSFPSHAILDLATKPCGGCDRLLSQNATICPACGFAFNERPEASVESQSTTFNIPKGTPTLSLDDDEPRTVITSQQSDTTVVDMDKTTLSLPEAGRKVNTNDSLIRIDSEFEEVDGSRTIEAFSQTCRLVRVEVQARGRRIVRQQLELISGDTWIPVLAYEVGNDCSTRHEYSRDGRRKSISIDLPSVAVGQMVQNELSQNWEKYCDRFLSGRKLSV